MEEGQFFARGGTCPYSKTIRFITILMSKLSCVFSMIMIYLSRLLWSDGRLMELSVPIVILTARYNRPLINIWMSILINIDQY